jgi:predicted nucleic acid-binding protein
VDTGLWIALISADDEHHDEADDHIEDAVARRVTLVTTNLVVAEVQRFLLFRAGPVAARAAIERIDASDRVTVVFATRAHHDAAKTWLKRLADQEISYTDAISFAVMKASGYKIAMSFDADFSIAGFELWRHQ